MDRLFHDSLRGKTFKNLMELISTEENIMLAYRNLKGNKGSMTAGADGRDITYLQKWETKSLVRHIQKKLKYYQPKQVRRVEIPKANGSKRQLGIPNIVDRLIQQAILQILEPICEAKFHERNNGFRPNRSTENAVAQCYKIMQVQKLHYVVDIDIHGFFDNIDHGKAIKQFWTLGIRDKRLLKILSVMMKAEIAGIGFPEKGAPQGAILSPLISNVVLNELDWWIASQWECMKTRHPYAVMVNISGSENKGAMFLALKKTRLKECFIVRYADDFKVFCRTKSACERLYHAIVQWLKERLGLEISKEKSRVVNLRKDYSEFLGFRMKVEKKQKREVVSSYMSQKSKKRAIKKLKNQIKNIQKPKDQKDEYYQVNIYNSMVMGMQNYYQIATNANLDFQEIAFLVNRSLNYRLRSRVKKKPEKEQKGYVYQRYRSSNQIRYISDRPVAPIGYIKHKNPMFKARKVNKYTPEGRRLIHKKLESVNMKTLHYLMRNPIINRSIEYNDNRLALYCANQGKCYVTGKPLTPERIVCHHIKPISKKGTDAYQNLVIMDKDVHELIHAIKGNTVREYVARVQPDYYARDKINRYRARLNLEPIESFLR